MQARSVVPSYGGPNSASDHAGAMRSLSSAGLERDLFGVLSEQQDSRYLTLTLYVPPKLQRVKTDARVPMIGSIARKNHSGHIF